MAFLTSYIIAPLIGSIIGYITNDLAIRMLFRPHTVKYVFGMHIPFTPGIIPKEKGRIAKAIGQVISENLMNQEVLRQYLLSDAMIGKLRSGVDGFIETQKGNEEILRQFIGHYLTEEEINGIATNINANLSGQIKSKLTDSTVGDKVAHLAIEHVFENLSSDKESDELLDTVIGMPKAIGKKILRTILATLQDSAERMLSRNINEILKNNGEEIVSNLIGTELNSFLDTSVKKLLAGKDEQLAKVTDKVEVLYRTVITEHLPRILETIDISKIVTDRINEMDVAETEKLILQVMKKELRAIVWLGAGLGFLMGWVNLLIC